MSCPVGKAVPRASRATTNELDGSDADSGARGSNPGCEVEGRGVFGGASTNVMTEQVGDLVKVTFTELVALWANERSDDRGINGGSSLSETPCHGIDHASGQPAPPRMDHTDRAARTGERDGSAIRALHSDRLLVIACKDSVGLWRARRISTYNVGAMDLANNRPLPRHHDSPALGQRCRLRIDMKIAVRSIGER